MRLHRSASLLLALAFTAACGGGDAGQSVFELSQGGGSSPSIANETLAGGHQIEQRPHGIQTGTLNGELMFDKQFKPSEGLGPFYNAVACSSCHSTPVIGGAAPLYRNFYLLTYGPPESQTGHPYLPSKVLPNFGGPGDHLTSVHDLTAGRVHMTPSVHGYPANLEQRGSISALGVGLFELVTNATIIGLSDPDDLDNDGISGRYNTGAGALGRFGTKSQANNLEGFTRGPLMNQMGITSNPFEGIGAVVSLSSARYRQVSADPNAATFDNDGVPDPEISPQDLGDLIAFTRDLPPPAKTLPFSAAATSGETNFVLIGCSKCHVPALPLSTGGTAEAYTDLLLHDLGTELAGTISFGSPQPSVLSPNHTASEWRTAPLWGIKDTPPYMHDGRVETLEEAILIHAGEALAVRQAYEALTQTERDEIIEFLEHL